jgi:hypothetical protein
MLQAFPHPPLKDLPITWLAFLPWQEQLRPQVLAQLLPVSRQVRQRPRPES